MDYREFGKTIWENNKLLINEFQGRYYLVTKCTGVKLKELTNGKKGLDKYYKGSFEIFIAKTIQKNIKARTKEKTYHLRCIQVQDNRIKLLKELQEGLK